MYGKYTQFNQEIRMDRLSGHWLPQLFARFFLSLAGAFAVVLLFHYGIAPKTPAGASTFFLLILPALNQADPLTLRRLSLGPSALTALMVLLTVLAAGLLTLPPLAFERVPGSFSVRFTLPQLFSLHALGALGAASGQILLGWILFRSSSLFRGEFTIRSFITCAVPWIIPAGILAGLHSDWGWRSDLAIGVGLLLAGAIVYFLMLRRGSVLYKPINKSARLLWM
jgi:hypothetical protein